MKKCHEPAIDRFRTVRRRPAPLLFTGLILISMSAYADPTDRPPGIEMEQQLTLSGELTVVTPSTSRRFSLAGEAKVRPRIVSYEGRYALLNAGARGASSCEPFADLLFFDSFE
jgi:hypothetical protein